MMEITAEIRALIDKAAAGVELAGDEYIDPADGLIHCKKCGGQRQTVVPCFGKPGYFMPRCICQCQREAEEQRKAAEERQRRMERIKRRKAQGLQDRYGRRRAGRSICQPGVSWRGPVRSVAGVDCPASGKRPDCHQIL